MQDRLRNIDGLRGLAASLVLFQHLCEQYSALAPSGNVFAASFSQAFLHILDLGKVGVVAFFAVSGFVVPFSFNDETAHIGFLVSRFFRLYPAYWLSLLLAVVLLPVISSTRFSAGQVIANITMLQEAFHSVDVLPVYWTLFVELVFYALCLAMFTFGRLYSPWTIFGLFILTLGMAFGGSILRARGAISVPVGIPLYIGVMLFGTMVRLGTVEGSQLSRRLLLGMVPLLVIVIPSVWLVAYNDGSHRETVIADILAFYLALALFFYCVIGKAFAAKPLVYVGSISYSLYLFHPIALEIGGFFGAKVKWPLSGVVLVLSTLVLSLGIAHFTFSRLEKPMVRRGREIAKQLARSATRKWLVMRERALPSSFDE
jgi:peptidoglycan/LPS O-acetylase OafA/YrhL